MKMDETKICIGIDLGTTNTSAAYSTLSVNGKISVEDLLIRQKGLGSQRTFDTLPSIIYIKQNGDIAVGREAVDLKDNSIRSSSEDVRYLENVKRYMGTQQKFVLDGKTYTPIDVATEILKYVRNYTQIKTMKSDYYTVITVPANFNTDQRTDTMEAARRAGFENVELYDEPKAAILSFLHEESEKREGRALDISTKKRILVIDIGGGTCDISVEDVVERNGEYVFTHMAVGRENLGGVDFDRRIGDELARSNLRGITLNDAEIASLRDMGQKIKEALSDSIDDFIWENYDGDKAALYEQPDWLDIIAEEEFECSQMREINHQPINFTMNVREFVNAITPLIYQIEEIPAANREQHEHNKNMETLIHTTLSDHDIDVDSIDVIFLTGGMAKCLPLRAALYELFQKPIISPANPFLAVSKGAALVNKYRSIEDNSKDLMPNAVMMEMDDGSLKTLIKMGEPVPVEKTVEETFKTVSGSGVAIRLFEGKNEFDSGLRKINNLYRITFSEAQFPGREFKIAYKVDKTKRINFTVTFPDNGETYHIDGQIREGK
ncbi:MAG: Hsp70 family protein [Clostridia bacterium]|nr:Hsp70 family protein [Clostridia bacterium]